MNRNLALLVVLAVVFCAAAQIGEDIVRKGSISVHTVERGSMPIFASARGKLTSLQPPRAILTFDDNDGNCEQGRSARLIVGESPRALAGRVVRQMETRDCEVEFL